MQWNADWIWNDNSIKYGSQWVCFRKKIKLNGLPDKAAAFVTADSRYVLYINGKRIGQGPVRSWNNEVFYDTYSVTEQIRQDLNVIAVLVTHYGTSNFQYLHERGGLLFQLEVALENGEIICYGTDSTWKAHTYDSYITETIRINPQLAWQEVFDSRKFDIDWYSRYYNDNKWDYAKNIGPAEKKPWRNILQRDIPSPAEHECYAERIEVCRDVKPFGVHVSVDLQQVFFPNMFDSNPRIFLGYVLFIINSDKNTNGKVIIPWDGFITLYGRFKINGRGYDFNEKREAWIELDRGDNLFLMDVSGTRIGFTLMLNFVANADISFREPFNRDAEFAVAGPFNAKVDICCGKHADNSLNYNHRIYNDIWDTITEEDLKQYKEHIRPVDPNRISRHNIYMDCVFQDILAEHDSGYEINNMIMPNNEYYLIENSNGLDKQIMADFGRIVSGYIEFDLEAPEGTVIDCYGVEYKDIYGGIQHTTGIHNTLRYICGKGRQCFRSETRRGLRYLIVTIRNITGPVSVYSIRVNSVSYPAAGVGRFKSSNDRLNIIWDVCKYTLSVCMEDTFVDCPTYEQALWTGDTYMQALAEYYTHGAYDIVKRSLKLACRSIDRTDIPEAVIPAGWKHVITAWSLLWVLACIDYFRHTGDTDFLKRIYPFMQRTADTFIDRINTNGLLKIQASNMIDWAPVDTPNRGIVTHQNALLFKVLKEMADVCGLAGCNQDVQRYSKYSHILKSSINRKLWDKDQRAYIDCIHENGEKSTVFSIQTNIMVLFCGCATAKRKEIVSRLVISPPKHFVTIGSPFFSYFYLKVLFELGYDEEALNYITEKWGHMVEHDSSCTWETFPGHEKGRLTRSYCHGWSANPAYFTGYYVLGIRPVLPGFKRVKIRICHCGLNWARGSVPVPGGRIDLYWKKEGGGTYLWFNGPRHLEYVVSDKYRVDEKVRLKYTTEEVEG